eukprot:gb/GECG01004851.1/.p1 GENE.gb/GECG01004851.1/~~gb/GECG01004851.1/.p1  ORF type:complete len:959 (+),score=151.97 gb/GECG01004851.1/:1-2877(+)
MSNQKDKETDDISADLMDVFSSSPKHGNNNRRMAHDDSFRVEGQEQYSNQGKDEFSFADDPYSDFESVKVFYRLQQQRNPGDASAHDLYYSKIGHLLLTNKLNAESGKKLETVVRRGYGEVIGPQLDSLLMTQDRSRIETISKLLWNRLKQKAPEALEEETKVEAESEDDEWWKEAEEVASPVRTTRRPSVIQVDTHVHYHSDSDSEDGEPGETHEPTPNDQLKRANMSFRRPAAVDESTQLGSVVRRIKEAANLQLTDLDEDSRAKEARKRRASIAASVREDQCEGVIYLRTMSKFLTRTWKPRFAVLQNGLIKIFADRMQRRSGSAPLEVLEINRSQGLSIMQTAPEKQGSHPRIFYRHIAELSNGNKFSEGEYADSNKSGQKRVLKFGCDNQNELDLWSRAIRAAIKRVAQREEKLERDIKDAEGVHSSTDEFAHAIYSSDVEEKDTGFAGQITAPSANEINYVTIELLNSEKFTVPVSTNATVKDTIIALRNQIGLRADAQYSLFLKDSSRARPMFTVLPDIMSIDEAEGLALAENKTLVYKRRIYYKVSEQETGSLASPSHSASRRVIDTQSSPINETLLVPPVEEEERSATHHQDAAHKLAYIDAVYNFIIGHMAIDVENAITLASLHAISYFGPYEEGQHTRHKVHAELRFLVPPTAIIEFVNLRGQSGDEEGIKGLATAIHKGFAAATSALKKAVGGEADDMIFLAQKLFMKKVKQFIEYGANFYVGDLRRVPSSSEDFDVPEWILEASTSDADRDQSDTVPVLLAINCEGVLIRPLPPVYTATEEFLNYDGNHEAYIVGRDPAENRDSLRLMKEYNSGRIVPWFIHPIDKIETWGVRADRPILGYTLRTVDEANIEVESPQYKELSSMIHMYVFTILALNEGQPLPRARVERHEYGSLAKATRQALQDAKNEAQSDLPTGWTEIMDPVTGSTLFWNIHTKKMVWSRPTE